MNIETAAEIIKNLRDSSTLNDSNVRAAIDAFKELASQEGLNEDTFHDIISVTCNKNLHVNVAKQLFHCLIPDGAISDDCFQELLPWIFAKLGRSHSLDQTSFSWIVGLLRYNLCDKNELRKYFYSFLFAMLDHHHIEHYSCNILYLIIEPEDVKKIHVKLVFDKWSKKGTASLAALLRRMKTYRPELLSDQLPSSEISYKSTIFDVRMKEASERYQRIKAIQDETFASKALKWRHFNPRSVPEKMLLRLIPPVEYLPRRSDFFTKPITDFKTLHSLGEQLTHIRHVAQTMSLLANEGGFLTLTFSDIATQFKFCHNLDEILETVILKNVGRYSENEKNVLLASLAALENYSLQGIDPVNKFLSTYLLMWDGMQFVGHILLLLEWFTFRDIESWNEVKPALRGLFRSNSTTFRCWLLRALSHLVENTVLVASRTQLDISLPFYQYGQDVNAAIIVNLVERLVTEMLQECFSWLKYEDRRIILTEALYFYEKALCAEERGDLPTTAMIPSCVIYTCLLSPSAYNIERLCSLLVKYESTVRERLHRLGAFEEYEVYYNQDLSAFLIDAYRSLFKGIGSVPDFPNGLLTLTFLEGLRQQGNVDHIRASLTLEKNPVWTESTGYSNSQSLQEIKELVERRLRSLNIKC